MKAGKATLIVVVALIGALASNMSLARGKGSRGGPSGSHHTAVQGAGGRVAGAHHHFGRSRLFFASTFVTGDDFLPWWDVGPYYPDTGITAAPIEYIEKTDDPALPNREWLYCPGTNTYYPSVTECAAGWEFVPVQPVGSQ